MEFNIKYKSYLRNIKNQGFFTCNKCKYIKTKKTNLEKYGVECSSQCDDVKDKTKKTNIEKYGVKSPLQNEDIKEKANLFA